MRSSASSSRPVPSARLFIVFVVFVVGVVSGALAMAAPDAGAKARGQFNFYSSSAHNAFSSARSHVGNYQRYLNETHGVPLPAEPTARPVQPAEAAVAVVDRGPVDAEIAREASDSIADDIERIQRHLKGMKAQAEGRGDAEMLRELADVDKQLAVARRGHAALHDHHASETISPATAMDLAEKVNAALRAAHAEHDDVMKRLGRPAAP